MLKSYPEPQCSLGSEWGPGRYARWQVSVHDISHNGRRWRGHKQTLADRNHANIPLAGADPGGRHLFSLYVCGTSFAV